MAMNYNAKEEDGHHASSVGSGPVVKSKKPDNTAFKQQRLPAWQPILTAGTVLPAFFIIGIVFIPIGIGIFVTSNNIREKEVDYTGIDPTSPCYKCLNVSWNSTNIFYLFVYVLQGNVFMYYGLSNFYQNHRRYVKSRDDSQLNGDKNSLPKECDPYRMNDNKPIAPCGAIANSMFNDSLRLYYISNGVETDIPLKKTGIAWWTDKNVKFKNPTGNTTNLENIFKDFIVWMRTAALPTFRKLYRLIEKPNSYPTLAPGNYSLSEYSILCNTMLMYCQRMFDYPVLSFDGRKRMILSTISWMGGKNPFLGIAYITVGSICFFLGVVLFVIHHKYGNRNNSSDIPN
ncbi:hypothetical protein GDO86_009863 [Hymenochirus boettgeri]|uniref:Cell cycle control protein n=1 Tax=Hymenochirus boettgeri TaxID=247094 RepID=A0A8T2JMA8_9PIPI|nr:hypothetical protein GDO86_009863 [Hymenochirus boettgeri]